MNDIENKDLTPQQPESPAEPIAEPVAAPAAEQATAPVAAPAEPAAAPAEPQPVPAAAPTIPAAAPVPTPTAEAETVTAPAQPQPEPAAAPTVPAPAAPTPAPIPEPAWEKPTPQLTLEPDPEIPAIEFTTEPPHAPEPPAEPQPTVQGQYTYNYNTPPAPNQNYTQGQPYSQPYAGYQPPNYTAQSYRPQPPQQPMYTTPPIGYQQKSRLAAGLLALMLGSLGIHNFYMGFNGRGTVQLLLSLLGGVLTCGLGTVAAAVWGLIEGVMLLSSTGMKFDGNGVIMKD